MSPTFLKLTTHLQSHAQWRLAHYFPVINPKPEKPPPLSIQPDNSSLNRFLQQHQISPDETLLLTIALVPHVQPHLFDNLILECMPQGGDFRPIGGTRSQHSRIFLPTGETAVFLLADGDLEKRFEVQKIFSPDHFFAQKHILWLEEVAPPGEPIMSGVTILNPKYIELFTLG